jgi:6-phosphogluconate dehydrogenase
MDLGMVGLGRMGGNMSERLLRRGHRVVGYARNQERLRHLVGLGGTAAESLDGFVAQLAPPRAVWLMIPSEAVDAAIGELVPLLAGDDIIVDGGNSYYKDSIRRAVQLAGRGVHFVDVGTSGGIWGLTEGYSLMVGGDHQVVQRLTPIFRSLAQAPDRGWGHVGPSGAGHFVKMIHNGIEYGMMQAYAEGFTLLHHKEVFGLDLRQVAEIWQHGSVVRSWLLDLAARALAENPTLEGIAATVADSGEGRWTVMEAIEMGLAIPVISQALERRFRSREVEPFGDRLLAVLREQFGGHAVTRRS